jgi:hypothetical protein
MKIVLEFDEVYQVVKDENEQHRVLMGKTEYSSFFDKNFKFLKYEEETHNYTKGTITIEKDFDDETIEKYKKRDLIYLKKQFKNNKIKKMGKSFN